MLWENAYSSEEQVEDALREVCGAISMARADLIVVFFSPHFVRSASIIGVSLRERFGGLVVGCSTASALSDGHEGQNHAALSVMVGELPGVALRGVRLGPAITAEPTPQLLRTELGLSDLFQPCFLTFLEPFSVHGERFTQAMGLALDGAPVIGGVASGYQEPGRNVVLIGSRAFRDGGVAVSLDGDVALDVLVAQGTRAVGERMQVTRAAGHLVMELDGTNATERLQEIWRSLPALEQRHFERHPLVGVTPRGWGPEVLVRQVIGVQPESGAVAVAHRDLQDRWVQLHVRDRHGTVKDLRDTLLNYKRTRPWQDVSGALMASCLVSDLTEPGYVGERLAEHLPGVPMAGFRANGELGPLHGRVYLHGFSNVIGVFRPRQWE